MEITQSVLLLAAIDIENYGWKSDGAEILGNVDEADPYGAYPRCPWIAISRVIERLSDTVSSSGVISIPDILDEAEQVLLAASQVADISEFFVLNDSQSQENGKQWAIQILQKAATLVSGVPVYSAQRVTDTGLTDLMESGNTTNVEGPARRFLRKLRLVK